VATNFVVYIGLGRVTYAITHAKFQLTLFKGYRIPGGHFSHLTSLLCDPP